MYILSLVRCLRVTQLRVERDAKMTMTKIVMIVAKNPRRANISSLDHLDSVAVPWGAGTGGTGAACTIKK
jgi:hypothetical protein